MAGATEVWRFAVTCPIGTPVATPITTNITMPSRTVLHIRVRVPPGPNGNMGFALGAAGQRVIPTGPVTFLVASDEIFDLALDQQIDSGAWQVQMYNVGNYPHTIYVDFTTTVPDAAGVNSPPTQLSSATLEQAGASIAAITSGGT